MEFLGLLIFLCCLQGWSFSLLWKFLWYEVYILVDGSDVWRHTYLHTNICTYIYIYFITYVHTRVHNTYISQTHTYIHCGHIWHRNKLASCQLEIFVSCSNDEHQTSLKWDRSSHPVTPKCSVSHTLHLKHFGMNVLRLIYNCLICWMLLHIV